jgi:hypothetical protein
MNVRQNEHPLALVIRKRIAEDMDRFVSLFNGPRHELYGFGAGGLVAAWAMAGAAFSIPRLTT